MDRGSYAPILRVQLMIREVFWKIVAYAGFCIALLLYFLAFVGVLEMSS